MGLRVEGQSAGTRPPDLPVPDHLSVMGVVGTLAWPLTLLHLHACGCKLLGRGRRLIYHSVAGML